MYGSEQDDRSGDSDGVLENASESTRTMKDKLSGKKNYVTRNQQDDEVAYDHTINLSITQVGCFLASIHTMYIFGTILNSRIS